MANVNKKYQITFCDKFEDLAVIQIWAKNKQDARRIAALLKRLIFNPAPFRRLWIRPKGRGPIKTTIEIGGL